MHESNSPLLSTLVNMAKNRGPLANDEYVTDSKYIEMARKVMGSIDLDPASSESAQEHVKAVNYYTRDSKPCGLTADWTQYKTCWLNPPYSKDMIKLFTSKVLASFDGMQDNFDGNAELIMLTNSKTSAQWYQDLVKKAQMLCIPRIRLSFYKDGILLKGNWQSQTFFYFGRRWQNFAGVYSEIGCILTSV